MFLQQESQGMPDWGLVLPGDLEGLPLESGEQRTLLRKCRQGTSEGTGDVGPLSPASLELLQVPHVPLLVPSVLFLPSPPNLK